MSLIHISQIKKLLLLFWGSLPETILIVDDYLAYILVMCCVVLNAIFPHSPREKSCFVREIKCVFIIKEFIYIAEEVFFRSGINFLVRGKGTHPSTCSTNLGSSTNFVLSIQWHWAATLKKSFQPPKRVEVDSDIGSRVPFSAPIFIWEKNKPFPGIFLRWLLLSWCRKICSESKTTFGVD